MPVDAANPYRARMINFLGGFLSGVNNNGPLPERHHRHVHCHRPGRRQRRRVLCGGGLRGADGRGDYHYSITIPSLCASWLPRYDSSTGQRPRPRPEQLSQRLNSHLASLAGVPAMLPGSLHVEWPVPERLLDTCLGGRLLLRARPPSGWLGSSRFRNRCLQASQRANELCLHAHPAPRTPSCSASPASPAHVLADRAACAAPGW